MTSAGLGVDADNPTGALGLYTGTGFEVERPLERLPQADGGGRMIETDRELRAAGGRGAGHPGPPLPAAAPAR